MEDDEKREKLRRAWVTFNNFSKIMAWFVVVTWLTALIFPGWQTFLLFISSIGLWHYLSCKGTDKEYDYKRAVDDWVDEQLKAKHVKTILYFTELENRLEGEYRKNYNAHENPQSKEPILVEDKGVSKEQKSDLWKPNEPKRSYEPMVVPRPSTDTQLDALKDIQVAQVQVLENIQKGLQKLYNELKNAGFQNTSLFENLNWELQALREQDVSVDVTKMENGKFRHWREARRYH